MATTHETNNSGEHHLAEDVRRSARSEDEDMGRRNPEAPFAFVALSYLAVLAVAGVAIGLVIYWLAR